MTDDNPTKKCILKLWTLNCGGLFCEPRKAVISWLQEVSKFCCFQSHSTKENKILEPKLKLELEIEVEIKLRLELKSTLELENR